MSRPGARFKVVQAEAAACQSGHRVDVRLGRRVLRGLDSSYFVPAMSPPSQKGLFAARKGDSARARRPRAAPRDGVKSYPRCGGK